MDRRTSDRDQFRVLVVEDDEIMLLSLVDRLKLEGIEAIGAPTLKDARWWLGTGCIDLVVCDIRLPDGTGDDLFREISRLQPGLPFILMTAFGSVADAVALVKAGAVDYLEKPFDLPLFIALIRRVLDTVAGMRLAENSATERFRLGSGLLGLDAAILRIERSIARMRNSDTPVLISGERGTGKKHVAALIHHNSLRATGPFVKLNCAPWENDGEVDAEFAAAIQRAVGGTLFLDEVAELPDRLQGRLIHLISCPHPDLRVIAARRTDGTAAGDEPTAIRLDLLWRLDVVHIRVPPLRERPEDIVRIARLFLVQAASTAEKRITGFSMAAETLLKGLKLPGNGRELRRLVERAVTLVDGPQIELHHLESEPEPLPEPIYLKTAVEEAERAAIRGALARCDGAIGKAAGILGISRKNLWEKMHRYGLER
jgi:DNA-binding NtrC family response regulator